MTEVAGWVADYASSGERLCYGFGETKAIVKMRVNHQIAGALQSAKDRIWSRITIRPVGPEEASEILEMLETPW